MGPAEIGQVGAACLEARRSAEKYTLRKFLTVLCCCMWGEGATEVTNYSLPCNMNKYVQSTERKYSDAVMHGMHE